MTNVGDPGHVTGHNTLEDGIRAQAERFGVAVTLGGPYAIGDPNHIGVHNGERDALAEIAAAGGITVTLPDPAALGDLGHTSDHDLMTAALAVIAAAPAWNDATGGTQSEVSNYNGTGQTWRVHRFTTAGTFTVLRALQPFRILVAGGGNGGVGSATPQSGSGGNGASVVAVDTQAIPEGAYAVAIGAGGAGQVISTGVGPYAGQESSLSGIATAAGGQGVGGGNGSYGYPGSGPALVSTITGASVTYAAGGTTGVGQVAQPNSGNGGDGGPSGGSNGMAGDSGVVIVAYRIG